MTNITMFDSVTTNLLPPGYAYAGYVDGLYANYNAIKAKFPASDVLSIAVFASGDAECLDIETGDATPAEAAAWVQRQVARGISRPVLYASASTMPQVLLHVSRASVRLWSAHYTGISHICGPHSCGQMTVDADGTQWTDNARNLNLDESLLVGNFFTGKADPPVSVIYGNVSVSLPVLKTGMSDATLPHMYVRRAQAVLNAVYAAGLTIDGNYGPATASAISRLVQANYGLTQDGICGPATWARLIAG